DRSVALEFLLKRDNARNLWQLYFGNIYAKRANGYQIAPQVPDFGTQAPKLDPITPGLVVNYGVLETLRAQCKQAGFSLPSVARKPDPFLPIKGVANPYPTYAAPTAANAVDNTYKNAVSGDFDLFSAWPVCPP